MSVRKLSVLAAAVAATLASRPAFAVVDGVVTGGEYAVTLGTQNAPTGFGNNFSELNQAFANYTPGGNLDLAITGNLEGNGNGLVIFIDSKAGGGVANSAGGGFNQFGSFGGARVDDWGTDTDGGPGVTPTPGGGSIVSPNFNPDYAIEINYFAPNAAYYTNIIDLTEPNTDTSVNRDIFLGQNTPRAVPADPPAAPITQTYFRDGGATDAGDITHAFDNTNTAGVNGYDFGNPPGPLGDPTTATSGFEWIFENQFISHGNGHALRILPFVTNGSGDFLSNQFLPGIGPISNLGGPGGDGGTPLLDSRFLGDTFYLDVFTPTATTGGSWSTLAWSGGVAPNGAEQAARLTGTTAATVALDVAPTVGYLHLDNPAGYTISGSAGPNFNGGNGSAILRVTSGSHSITALNTTLTTSTRVNVASGASLAISGGLSIGANRTLSKAGTGALTLSGTQAHGAGASIAVDAGSLVVNSNLGTGLAVADRPDVYVSNPTAGATVTFNSTQQLDQFHVNDTGIATVGSSGGTRVVVANDFQVNGTGKLDLSDNKVIIKGGTPLGSWDGTAYTGVVGLVQSGYAGGSQSGNGIYTSQAAATSPNVLTAVVVMSADEAGYAGGSFMGEAVASGDIIAMYSWGGDANMDGTLNGDDYFEIDSNIAAAGTVFGYGNGDFNYDGDINGDDYFIIDSNIAVGQAATPFPTAGGVAGLTAVPEPASVAVAALGGLGLLRRRRRQA